MGGWSTVPVLLFDEAFLSRKLADPTRPLTRAIRKFFAEIPGCTFASYAILALTIACTK